MSNEPEWRFRKMSRGDMNIDPIESQFFSTEALGSITDALVRESIQNSLDAALADTHVRVRISFPSDDKLPGPDARQRCFASLWPHLQSKQSGLKEIPTPDEPLRYITIEDYETRGLQGDIRQYDDKDNGDEKNDFYYFWRNIGRSGKERLDRGRWGLGKTVFQASSRINSFFGFTTRESDERSLLMGQSVLKIHRANGARYIPYGYFGLFDETFALPVEDAAIHELFCADFGLDRKSKRGLAVVIPYPDPDIKPAGVIHSVIKHYLFPILSGDLVVEIVEANRATVLDTQSLPSVVRRSQFDDRRRLIRLLDLARWGQSQPEDAHVRLEEPTPGKAPKLRVDLFEAEALDLLRRKFDEGQRIALTIPLSIQEKSSREVQHSYFQMYLERDPDLEKPEDHFIRQGITITGVSSLRTKGVRAIVNVADPSLCTFLGDAENPAHTEWQRNSPKVKDKYRLAPSTLDFIKGSTRDIARILSRPAKQREENLLRDIFSVPLTEEELLAKRKKASDNPGDEESEKPIIHVDPREQFLRLSSQQDGFRLTGNPNAKRFPTAVDVTMAYEVRKGNPLNKYQTFDFEVDKAPIRVQLSGAKVTHRKNNVIHLLLEKPGFVLVVTGFDVHRDLRIKTKTAEESEQ